MGFGGLLAVTAHLRSGFLLFGVRSFLGFGVRAHGGSFLRSVDRMN